MLKEKLKKFMPDKQKIINSKSMKIFGDVLHNPNLWHLSKKSIANALAVGLFCAWIPVPFQMILAAGFSIIFQANVALAVGCVWVSNPITIPPMFIFAYKVGAFVLGSPPSEYEFSLSFQWLTSTLQDKWLPFFLGCLICAVASSFIGYMSVKIIWRYDEIRKWLKNKKKQR